MDQKMWNDAFTAAKDKALASREIAETGQQDEMARFLDAQEEPMRELSADRIEAIARIDRSIGAGCRSGTSSTARSTRWCRCRT